MLLDPDLVDEKVRSKTDREQVLQWLYGGDVRWAWEEDDEMCGIIAGIRKREGYSHGPPRVLNTGSGPLAPSPLNCGDGAHSELGSVPVVAVDGLARFYLRVYDFLDLRPPHVSGQCEVEELRACFPRNHFDVVHMRNALDHTMDPVVGLEQMLEVVRPGGRVLLRHAINEGLPGQFQFGLHQWSFDATRRASTPHFVIWNPMLRVDVTKSLLERGLAEQVITELRPHPEDKDGKEMAYIFVDIQKPPR